MPVVQIHGLTTIGAIASRPASRNTTGLLGLCLMATWKSSPYPGWYWSDWRGFVNGIIAVTLDVSIDPGRRPASLLS